MAEAKWYVYLNGNDDIWAAPVEDVESGKMPQIQRFEVPRDVVNLLDEHGWDVNYVVRDELAKHPSIELR